MLARRKPRCIEVGGSYGVGVGVGVGCEMWSLGA
jgi:hypothetical protein